MPYGTVNLRHGVPNGETQETCTAGVGTFIVEFATLSRLTGDPTYESVAHRAMNQLWARRSSINLVIRTPDDLFRKQIALKEKHVNSLKKTLFLRLAII